MYSLVVKMITITSSKKEATNQPNITEKTATWTTQPLFKVLKIQYYIFIFYILNTKQ